MHCFYFSSTFHILPREEKKRSFGKWREQLQAYN